MHPSPDGSLGISLISIFRVAHAPHNAMFHQARHKLKQLLPVALIPPRDVAKGAPLSLEEKLWRLENDPAWRTLDLPISDAPDAVEEIIVEQIGRNLYRIASSPGMIEGLAADDLIELDAQAPAQFRLVRRGLNVCIHLFCTSEAREAVRAALTKELSALGGWLDGTMGATGLCFTIPVDAGFPNIEAALRKVVGEEWSYSNVYDPITDEPLNWW